MQKEDIFFSVNYFFSPHLVLESIVQPGVSIKYFILMWFPELRASPLFRVRKPMLTTSPASLAATAWMPVLLCSREGQYFISYKYH